MGHLKYFSVSIWKHYLRSQNARTPFVPPATIICGWVGCLAMLDIPTRSIDKWQILLGTSSVLRKSHSLTWPRLLAVATWSCFKNKTAFKAQLSALVNDRTDADRFVFKRFISPADPTVTIWSPEMSNPLHEKVAALRSQKTWLGRALKGQKKNRKYLIFVKFCKIELQVMKMKWTVLA